MAPREKVLGGFLNTQAKLVDECPSDVVNVSPEYTVEIHMITGDPARPNLFNAHCTVNEVPIRVTAVYWNPDAAERVSKQHTLIEAAIRQYQQIRKVIE